MSAAGELKALLTGVRPDGGLLQTLRLEAGGAEYYGEEAVLERGRAAPLDLGEAEAVANATQLALFGPSAAAVADVYDGRIGRAWAIGGPAAEPEPSIAVAFDPDLHQARGGVICDPRDHPHADAALVDALTAAGEQLIGDIVRVAQAYRARAFLVRAFGEAERGAGLFALHTLGPGPERMSDWSFAAVLVDPKGVRVVRDEIRPATLTEGAAPALRHLAA